MQLQLDEASLHWALNQALNYGDTDIFPPAFEFRALKHAWPDLGKALAKQDLFTWTTRAYRRCLSPKHRYGFRIATQLDPLDFLLFTAATYEVGHELEASRVSFDHAVSYRFAPGEDGRMYDPAGTFRQFLERSL